MSLEAQIAAVVQSTNALITNFNTKKKEIDDGVAAALRQVVDNVRVIYVDALTGSDTATGASTAPLRTIAEVCKRIPSGGQARVILRGAQNHEIAADLDVRLRHIAFETWTPGTPKASISFRSIGNGVAGEVRPCYIDCDLSLLGFYNVVFATPMNPEGAIHGTGSGVFRYGRASAKIKFDRADISIGDAHVFATRPHSDSISLSVSSTKFDVPGSGFFVRNTAVVLLNVGAVTLPPGVVWSNPAAGQRSLIQPSAILRDAAGVPRNWISNIIL